MILNDSSDFLRRIFLLLVCLRNFWYEEFLKKITVVENRLAVVIV